MKHKFPDPLMTPFSLFQLTKEARSLWYRSLMRESKKTLIRMIDDAWGPDLDPPRIVDRLDELSKRDLCYLLVPIMHTREKVDSLKAELQLAYAKRDEALGRVSHECAETRYNEYLASTAELSAAEKVIENVLRPEWLQFITGGEFLVPDNKE